ncbi:MAG: hypothetical protein J1F35_03370 [Erysipelotrichales bacterium]|nr:hypothetical protein [Erysipelotrichales bacterium]
MEDKEKIKQILDLIDSLEKEDEIVFLDVDTFRSCNIENMLNQSIESILYDLNRGPEVLKTLMNLDENKWCINDIALVILFKRVFKKLQEYEK